MSNRINPLQDKIDEVIKIQNERKAILNIPVSFEDSRRRGKID